MSRPAMRLVPCDRDEADVTLLDPHAQATEQAQEASNALMAQPEDYLRFPWSALDAVLAGIPRGQLWYLCAFSGDGKTTFLTSVVLEWMAQGKTVYYMGLETTPAILRTHFACKTLGYDAGDLLSGAYLKWHNAAAVKSAVRAELRRMAVVEQAEERKLLISDAAYLDVATVRAEAALAVDAGAEILIVDHVDHLSGAGRLYDMSVAVNKALLDVARDYGLWVIAASQYNNDAVRGNRALRYMMPQPTYIYMGSHKRQYADGLIGLYRPLKVAGVDKSTLKAFRAGMGNTADILEPNTMAVGVMKHRLYGSREGSKIYLRVEHGRVLDANQALYTGKTQDHDGFRGVLL